MSLVRVGRGDARQAGSLLARAFHRDPLLVHMLPDERERTRLAPDHFERVVLLAVTTGEVWRTERFDGVACWIAPGRWPSTSAEEGDAGLYEIPVIVGAEAWEQFRTVYAAMDHAHGGAVTDPHWVLPLIGVEPGRQGHGLGSTLLRPLLERANEDGKTCYLETLNETNLEFYARHGFRVAIDEVEPVSGLRYWCCIRPPALGSASLRTSFTRTDRPTSRTAKGGGVLAPPVAMNPPRLDSEISDFPLRTTGRRMSIETQELAVRYGSARPRQQPRPVIDTERYNAVARISARFK